MEEGPTTDRVSGPPKGSERMSIRTFRGAALEGGETAGARALKVGLGNGQEASGAGHRERERERMVGNEVSRQKKENAA